MRWDRHVILTININGIIKEYDNSLRIDFNVSKGTGGLGESADITIYGLNLVDIDFLAKSITYDMNPSGIVNADSMVSLSAGYKDNINLIFSGNLTEAHPNINDSTYIIILKAIAGYKAKELNQFRQVSIKNTNFKAVGDNIANALGYKLNFLAQNKDIGDYCFYGDPLNELMQFRKAYNKDISIYIENGILNIIKSNGYNAEPVILISGDSGMIGSPSPMFKGVSLQCFLMPSLSLGGRFQLSSNKLPSLNGEYIIQVLKHKGSNRADEFISEIEGRAV